MFFNLFMLLYQVTLFLLMTKLISASYLSIVEEIIARNNFWQLVHFHFVLFMYLTEFAWLYVLTSMKYNNLFSFSVMESFI